MRLAAEALRAARGFFLVSSVLLTTAACRTWEHVVWQQTQVKAAASEICKSGAETGSQLTERTAKMAKLKGSCNVQHQCTILDRTGSVVWAQREVQLT
jgi:uncharacterized membrane protein